METPEQKSFFKTKAGGLAIAFIAIMIAFFIILAGLNTASNTLCTVGFAIIVISMLYSPFKVYILDRRSKR